MNCWVHNSSCVTTIRRRYKTRVLWVLSHHEVWILTRIYTYLDIIFLYVFPSPTFVVGELGPRVPNIIGASVICEEI